MSYKCGHCGIKVNGEAGDPCPGCGKAQAFEVWAIVALGLPEINKDLAVELTTTLQRRFCCWYFIQRDDGKFNLVLSSSLIGATIDQAELATAVLMVAYNSNDLDDQIVAKYGGSVFAGE